MGSHGLVPVIFRESDVATKAAVVREFKREFPRGVGQVRKKEITKYR